MANAVQTVYATPGISDPLFFETLAQADWLTRFRTLTRGRTALVITHSFTTAMHADIIHVMEGGRIVESGAHDRLLAQGGRYAWSWRAQYRQEAAASANPAAHLKLVKSDS